MTPITVKVTSNIQQVVYELMAASDEMRNKTVASALNKTAAQVKVQAARAVRDAGYNLKVSTIKKAIRLRNANAGNLRAVVYAKGRPIPMIEYNARPSGKGVSVTVLRGRQTLVHAFIRTMPNGHVGVFERKADSIHKKQDTAKKYKWAELKIKEKYGPSVPDGMANEVVQELLQRFIAERFPRILQQENNWLSRKLGAKGG